VLFGVRHRRCFPGQVAAKAGAGPPARHHRRARVAAGNRCWSQST